MKLIVSAAWVIGSVSLILLWIVYYTGKSMSYRLAREGYNAEIRQKKIKESLEDSGCLIIFAIIGSMSSAVILLYYYM